MGDATDADGPDAEALRRENEELREKVLDLEDALSRVESQHEVLENFCFALEKEHDQARSLVENTRAELQKSYEAVRTLKEDQDEIFATVTQGILTLNQDGSINAGYSQAAGQILERGDLSSMPFVDLLSDESLKKKFERFLALQFTPTTQTAMLNRLNPLADYSHEVTTEDGVRRVKSLGVSFARIWRRDGEGGKREVRKVLVVIDDQTTERELNRELERRAKEQARKVETAYQILMLPPGAYSDFVAETDEGLDFIEGAFDSGQVSAETHRKCARVLHTLKGSARALGLDYVQHKAHRLESILEELKEDDGERLGFRVREGLKELRSRIREGDEMSARIAEMKNTLQVDRTAEKNRLERLLDASVRTEAAASGKEAALEFRDDVLSPVPRHFRLHVKNALIQMVRNAVAHGLELAAQRTRLGKRAEGDVVVRLNETEDAIVVTCRDDGQGIRASEIRERAVAKGLATAEEVERLDDEQALELIFLPGFSTARSVDESAGRGVGMDVVAESASALGGKVRVETEVGRYTVFHLELPKRTALADLPVEADQEHAE